MTDLLVRDEVRITGISDRVLCALQGAVSSSTQCHSTQGALVY